MPEDRTAVTDEIRFERRGRLGIVILDRPRALNALTRPMIRALSLRLAAWKDDPAIAAVLVKAVPGRAFCAGGDILAVAETIRRQSVAAAVEFFHDEYRLDWRVHAFPKPYIALLDGITMGGGVGISVHGRYRVVTENALFAMPETGIGFFPDVGGSWYLPRLPGALGTWLGLTGARLSGPDCLVAGIATHGVPAARLPELEERLVETVTSPDEVDEVLTGFAAPIGEPRLPDLRARIDHGFGAESLAEMLERLGHEPTGFGAEQLETLAGKSPLSVRVALEQLRRGRDLGIEACLAMEYRIVHRILEAGDFAEGVRALLVDKDKQPRWRYASFAEVPEAEVEAMFAPLPQGELSFDWRDV